MTCFSKMWLVRNFHKIKILAVTGFLYLVSPVILLCIFILLVYRGIVAISAKVTRKDLEGMISPSTSAYASDELYGIPNRNSVCFLILKGRLSIETLQNRIDKNILSVKNTKGTYKYHQLRMYPCKFQRFLFWKMEDEFKVDNHVMMYEKAKDDNRIWTETDVHELQKNLIRKQWTRFTSPWEILLIPNYRTQSCGGREVKTVLCVRFHMCIGNEVSWMKILCNFLCDSCDESTASFAISSDPTENDFPVIPFASPEACSFPQTTFVAMLPSISSSTSSSTCCTSSPLPGQVSSPTKRGGNIVDIFGKFKSIRIPFKEAQRKCYIVCQAILKKLAIPFQIPYDFAEQIMEPLSSNEWHVEETSLLKRDHVVLLDRFSVQHVREIKNSLGVNFSSVLIAALSSALRLTFMEAGFKIPTHMKVMLPLNCNKSSTLLRAGSRDDGVKEGCRSDERADGSICWINLPLGISASKERLKCCETAQKKLSNSTKLITNRVLLNLIGLLPFKYHWHFLRKRPWTGVLMNIIGPSDTLSICEHQIEDVIVSSASDSGFVLSFVSYADYLRISLVIDYRLLPNEVMARNLLKNIYAELVLLGIEGAVGV